MDFDTTIFSTMEWRVLEALNNCFMDTCPSYRGLMYDLDLPELPNSHFQELKKAVQHLKQLGYVVVEHGLMNDDGEVAGSGFSLAYEKRRLIDEMINTYHQSVHYETVQNMLRFGGSFVKALARAAECADPINLKKLVQAFPDYFDEYHPTKWSA